MIQEKSADIDLSVSLDYASKIWERLYEKKCIRWLALYVYVCVCVPWFVHVMQITVCISEA